MSCVTESGNPTAVNFYKEIITESKITDRLVIKNDPGKADADEVEEDDVFANENAEAMKGENTSNENYHAPIVSTSSINGVKSPVLVVVSSSNQLPNSQIVAAINNNTSVTVSPTTTTPRRPSYTSKAPSALVNLPKTIDEIDNNNTIGASTGLSNFALNSHTTTGVELKGNIHVSDFSHDSIRSSAKELLHLHSQGSYEIDEYSGLDSIGTESSNSDETTPANVGNINAKVKPDAKLLNAELTNAGRSWDQAASADVLTVRCREHIGELYRNKFGSGSKGKSIKFGDKWCTPIEFETLAGRASCKDWKRSIRFHGQHLQKLIEDRFLTLHAISCTCGICRGDETLNGPVKLFQAVKRKGSQLNSPHPHGKKKSFSEGFFKRERLYSVDGDVFTMVTQDDGTMPPMTPLTPMTPITPHTPFGTNCMTPLAVPAGVTFTATTPPKPIAIQVPITAVSTALSGAITTGVSTLSSRDAAKSDGTVVSSTAVNYTALPPPSTPKLHPQVDINSQQHWIQLEEMATNLVSIAHKLRLMIDQVKIQSEANKDSAVTQAKIQAESEKAEAISLVRRGQLQQIIGTTAAAITTSGDSASQTSTPQYMVMSKVCQNCGREAYLECTGCYRSYYCGQFCQQKDWVSHKTKCRSELGQDDSQQQQPQQQQQQQTSAPSITVTPATTSE